jgi:fatty-acyl-CoA synthase
MVGRLIQVAKSAYQYPLILKQLWHTPLVQTPDQEVVYRDQKRFTYRQIGDRIGRLASALTKSAFAQAIRSAFSIGTATGSWKPSSQSR